MLGTAVENEIITKKIRDKTGVELYTNWMKWIQFNNRLIRNHKMKLIG